MTLVQLEIGRCYMRNECGLTRGVIGLHQVAEPVVHSVIRG